MSDNLLVSLLLNISFLLLVATVLTEIRPFRLVLKRQQHSLHQQLMLVVLFSLSSISCTYTGLELQGAVVNTRVVSTLVAGLIGGPFPGLATGLISGIHRYLFNPEGFIEKGGIYFASIQAKVEDEIAVTGEIMCAVGE